MFRGNHPAKVDEKGRLKLPAAFKQLLDAQNVTQFYITSADGKSAEIWPLPEWEKREAQLAEFSTLDDAVHKYLNLTSYYGQQVEMDNQARCPAAADFARQGQAGLGCCGLRQDRLTWKCITGRSSSRICRPTHMTAEDRKALAAILSRRS